MELKDLKFGDLVEYNGHTCEVYGCRTVHLKSKKN